MALHNPFTPISKDAPVTRVQRLEARTPDGRFVSHANDAEVVHLRMRQHPRSQLLRVTRRGGRSGTRGSSIGKAAPRMLVNAARFARADIRENPGKTAVAGVAGLGLGLQQRKRTRDKAALAQTGMAKRYTTDTFGKSSADRTVIGHWGKANSNIPDGARRGRRLVAD